MGHDSNPWDIIIKHWWESKSELVLVVYFILNCHYQWQHNCLLWPSFASSISPPVLRHGSASTGFWKRSWQFSRSWCTSEVGWAVCLADGGGLYRGSHYATCSPQAKAQNAWYQLLTFYLQSLGPCGPPRILHLSLNRDTSYTWFLENQFNDLIV